MKKEEIQVGQTLRFVIPKPYRVIAEKVIVTAIDPKTGIVSVDNPDDDTDAVYSAHPNKSTGDYDCLEKLD